MSKEVLGFITCDSFIDNTTDALSLIYELSDIALTYSKNKQQYHSTIDPLYSLFVFSLEGATSLTQDEADNIIKVVTSLSSFLTTNNLLSGQQAIITFTNEFNQSNPNSPISNLNYSREVNYNLIRSVDYLSFTISDINCQIWLSDSVFRLLYPKYEINIILPFENFNPNNPNFISLLDNFNFATFNERIEENKAFHPPTYTKILNIPYHVPNTNIDRDCYFAFNIYGNQGNYDHILKLELYNYMINNLNMTTSIVEELFPSLLKINEFFIIPRWDKIAIPSQVGQGYIASQISYAFNEPFDIDKFIKVYNNINFLRNNTYSVPFDYNNILLHVVNGYYSEENVKDFKSNFSDLITVTSTHPDFARMSTRTQHLVTLLENMITICDCNNFSELFNSISSNRNYRFSIITRADVTYLSLFWDKHQYYMIPKYQFMSLLTD